MDPKIPYLFNFLKDIAANNNRQWFAEHRDRYQTAKSYFEEYAQQIIVRIAEFDADMAHLNVKDCTYRIYRDTRFSTDKSPYKRHFGIFVNSHGKQSYRCGYYLHIQPDGQSLIAGGTWCPPSNVMRAVRQAIVDEIEEFRDIVENKEFKKLFPVIGEAHLKTMAKGFPKDFAYPQYLRAKDFNIICMLPDEFFFTDNWMDNVIQAFRIAKPYNDFINYTIDEFL